MPSGTSSSDASLQKETPASTPVRSSGRSSQKPAMSMILQSYVRISRPFTQWAISMTSRSTSKTVTAAKSSPSGWSKSRPSPRSATRASTNSMTRMSPELSPSRRIRFSTRPGSTKRRRQYRPCTNPKATTTRPSPPTLATQPLRRLRFALSSMKARRSISRKSVLQAITVSTAMISRMSLRPRPKAFYPG